MKALRSQMSSSFGSQEARRMSSVYRFAVEEKSFEEICRHKKVQARSIL